MTKQTFKTPLNFQNVSVGTLEDKVLVRSANGDVKEVPSDSFGGGGSQGLQGTLDESEEATGKGIYLTDGNFETTAIDGSTRIVIDGQDGNIFFNRDINAPMSKSFVIKSNKILDGQVIAELPALEALEDGQPYTMPFSVNGQLADENGNIAIPSGGTVVIVVSKSDFDTLVSSNALVPDSSYKIIGVEAGWCDIIVKAISNNAITTAGIGIFKNPDFNTYQIFNDIIGGFTFSDLVGVFQYGEQVTSNNGAKAIYYTKNVMKFISGDWETSTSMTGDTSGATVNITDTYNLEPYNVDDIVIWGNAHWKNVTGLVSASIDDFTLDENWVKTDEGTKLVGDSIEYNYEGDFISMRSDSNGNVIKTRGTLKGFPWGRTANIFNTLSEFGGEICNISTESEIRFNIIPNCFFEMKGNGGLSVRDVIASTLNLERIASNALSIYSCKFDQMNLADIFTQINIQYVSGDYINLGNNNFPESGVSIKNIEFRVDASGLSNIDFSASTFLFDTDIIKTVYKKSNGVYKISYMNSSDLLTVVDIDA